MKEAITILVFLSSAISTRGQEKLLQILPLKDGAVTYTNIVQVDSVDKEELYNRAKRWFVTIYKSAKDVIQLDDKENGEIIGKGNFNIVYYKRDPHIDHTISISVKDGRFKYIITDLRYSDNSAKFRIEDFPESWAERKNCM